MNGKVSPLPTEVLVTFRGGAYAYGALRSLLSPLLHPTNRLNTPRAVALLKSSPPAITAYYDGVVMWWR
jgi:hypothetical protein